MLMPNLFGAFVIRLNKIVLTHINNSSGSLLKRNHDNTSKMPVFVENREVGWSYACVHPKHGHDG